MRVVVAAAVETLEVAAVVAAAVVTLAVVAAAGETLVAVVAAGVEAPQEATWPCVSV
jgi:hypothetical protein